MSTKKKILIVGATSGIAEAVAREYAGAGCTFALVARSQEKLEVVASDLRARGAAGVSTYVWNATEPKRFPDVVERAWRDLGEVDVTLIAHGTLPDQARAAADLDYAIEQFRTNGESAIVCMLALAPRFEAQGGGTLAVIGSVAGDRGRPSNFLYGAAKSSVEAFASGMRGRLFKRGVNLLLIKPGFVATPMTAGLDLPKKLTATPQRVARTIVDAVSARKSVIYVPWFWQVIMTIIKMIPTFVFKKLGL
ncbi:SDR family oxidoreductase [Variovorax atrisoli]|uniref:SDR family oxidoreductase n=1 Tax=Variovorax atrisoli TaxID=3394203 RepID=UPI000378BAD4|nr:SDR family oxidoreductase [Variovorax paradoxus]